MPRQSPSNRPVIVIGRGRGIGRVLRALRPTGVALNVIVAVAEGPEPGPSAIDGAGSGQQAQDEIRRSLELLAGDSVALARALSRPLMIERLGVHPLGNLLLESLANALGELGTASEWLGEQLGINGAVLPAGDGPLSCAIEQRPDGPHLWFVPRSPAVSDVVVDAIRGARWIVLAPGRPLEVVLPAAAIPAIAVALRQAAGRIVWIDDRFEAAAASADDLTLIRSHGVRVDAVLEVPRIASPRGRSTPGDAVVVDADSAGDEEQRLRVALTEYLALGQRGRA